MDQRLHTQLGIPLKGDEQKPVYDSETMGTPVRGVYVAGTATGGNQHGYSVFITTSHAHCTRIARTISPGAAIDDGWVRPSCIVPTLSRKK